MRTIDVVTDRGDLPTECHGTFYLNFDGIDVMFAIATRPNLDKLCVVEYVSGCIWRIPFEHQAADVSPSSYPAIEAEAIAKLRADTVLRGGEATVAQVIQAQQQRYKTNELDF